MFEGRWQSRDDEFEKLLTVLETVHPPFRYLRDTVKPNTYCSLIRCQKRWTDGIVRSCVRMKIRDVHDIRKILKPSPFSDLVVGYRSYGNTEPFIDAYASYIFFLEEEFENLVMSQMKC